MSISPGTFMTAIAEHLASDAELQRWSQQNLGRPLTVQVGSDEDNPPSIDSYPIVVLVSCVKERGDARQPVIRLNLGCGLVDAGIVESENLRVYSGIAKGADLGHQVEAAMFRSNLGSFELVGDHLPISFHPIHVTNTSVSCTLVKSSRQRMR